MLPKHHPALLCQAVAEGAILLHTEAPEALRSDVNELLDALTSQELLQPAISE